MYTLIEQLPASVLFHRSKRLADGFLWAPASLLGNNRNCIFSDARAKCDAEDLHVRYAGYIVTRHKSRPQTLHQLTQCNYYSGNLQNTELKRADEVSWRLWTLWYDVIGKQRHWIGQGHKGAHSSCNSLESNRQCRISTCVCDRRTRRRHIRNFYYESLRQKTSLGRTGKWGTSGLAKALHWDTWSSHRFSDGHCTAQSLNNASLSHKPVNRKPIIHYHSKHRKSRLVRLRHAANCKGSHLAWDLLFPDSCSTWALSDFVSRFQWPYLCYGPIGLSVPRPFDLSTLLWNPYL